MNFQSIRQTYQDLWKARLSRRVAAWVFVSLVIIEGIILIPSYANRRRELLKRKEQVSAEILAATKQGFMESSTDANLSGELRYAFDRFGQSLNPESIVKGGALYSTRGELIGKFGESVDLDPRRVGSRDRLTQITQNGTRYEAAWGGANFNDQYILVISHDSSDLGLALLAYVGRILLLVFIISIVVTASTMAVVTSVIITPFLTLRDDFGKVVHAIRETDAAPCFETLSTIELQSQTNQQNRDEITEVFEAFHQMFGRIYDEIQQRQTAEQALRGEQAKTEKLLLNILPESIAEKLKNEEGAIADKFDCVSILFADLVNFTCLSTQIPPVELVALLNEVFTLFDTLAEAHQLEKIKTIGDAYMVASGIPEPRADHAEAIAAMALEMQSALHRFNAEQNQNFELRIGINSGPIVAGVIGRRKFAYDLWGDTVNVASRMESHGIPSKIQVTEFTYSLLKDKFDLEYRGQIEVKGRGTMDTYFLKGGSVT